MLLRHATLVAVTALGSIMAAEERVVLSTDDECIAAEPEDHAYCALNALQHRKASREITRGKKDASAHTSDRSALEDPSWETASEDDSYQTASADAGDTILSVYHWSPHWQCFTTNSSFCKEPAIRSLNHDLQRLKVDFASLIELVDWDYRPPKGYRMTKSLCNDLETAHVIYKTSRWRPVSATRGCMRPNNRAFVVQVFENKIESEALDRVMVVAAHYPHSWNVTILRDAIGHMIKATGEHRIVLLADTNQEIPSQEIASFLRLPSAGNVMSSPLFVSCCHHIHDGFVFPYDRIVANFGDNMTAHLLHDPPPKWGGQSMHKGVRAIITVTSDAGAVVAVQKDNSSQGRLQPPGNSSRRARLE